MELCKFVHDHAQRILYYPACGEDWEPLCQLNQYCDVFVYCDTLRSYPHRTKTGGKIIVVRRNSSWLEDQFSEIPKRTSAGNRLQVQEVKNLKTWRCPRSFKLKPFGSWAKLVTLTLKENGVIRPLKMVYIKGHGEILYRTLFFNKSIAPRIVCLRHPSKKDFLLRSCILAQLVINGTSKPEFIVTHYPLLENCDWGWNQLVQRKFDGWDNLKALQRNNPKVRRKASSWGRVSLLARPECSQSSIPK
jgi:hypothetical protein